MIELHLPTPPAARRTLHLRLWEPILTVFVQGSPKAQPRMKATAIGGFARVYDPGTAKPWRERVWAHLLPFKPPVPLDEPLRLELEFLFERPASHWSKRGGLKPSAPLDHEQKPDLDNLEKAIMDELTQQGFLRDDSRIVSKGTEKFWSDEPGRFGCMVSLFRVQARNPA